MLASRSALPDVLLADGGTVLTTRRRPRFHVMRTRHEGARAFKVADGDRIRALCFTREDADVVVRSLELAAPYFGRPHASRRPS